LSEDRLLVDPETCATGDPDASSEPIAKPLLMVEAESHEGDIARQRPQGITT
jgi:hypothetical protein